MKALGEVVDAGIDYISATMKNDNPNLQPWLLAAQAYLLEISAEGGEVLQTRRLGYDGIAYGGSFLGERERDTIAIFSGGRAKRAYYLLYRSDLHISRFDVQVSYKFLTPNSSVAQNAREQVIRDNAKIGAARQRNSVLIEDLRGGSTCYIGSRTSEQFARIYNKEAESNDARYERTWRYEVQLKNRLAGKAAEQFATGTYAPEVHAAVFVKQWLRHRGVSTPWKASAELLPLPVLSHQQTPVEEKLKWLRSHVRPAIRQLLKYGLEDDIMDALGLVVRPPDSPEDSREQGGF